MISQVETLCSAVTALFKPYMASSYREILNNSIHGKDSKTQTARMKKRNFLNFCIQSRDYAHGHHWIVFVLLKGLSFNRLMQV